MSGCIDRSCPECAGSTLSDFLLARITEDEAALVDGGDCRCADATPQRPDCPDRIAAECEAKRRIVEDIEWLAGDVLRLLALPYADHPDYQEEWKP